jgi:hypothetical protein
MVRRFKNRMRRRNRKLTLLIFFAYYSVITVLSGRQDRGTQTATKVYTKHTDTVVAKEKTSPIGFKMPDTC